MIPENEPTVESKITSASFVKPEDTLPLGTVTGFAPAHNPCTEVMLPPAPTLRKEVVDNYFSAIGVTTQNEPMKTMTIDDIHQTYRMMEDRALDQDVKLLEAFHALGAVVSINEWAYPGDNGPIVVALPPRYKRAEREIERRAALREKAADHAARYTMPRYIYPPNFNHDDPWGFGKSAS